MEMKISMCLIPLQCCTGCRLDEQCQRHDVATLTTRIVTKLNVPLRGTKVLIGFLQNTLWKGHYNGR